MPNAKIVSIDAIKQFRSAMIKFAEGVNAALGNSDSDVHRAVNWLDMEAKTYWQNEIRKAQVKLAAAQDAMRMKTLYKNIDGTTPSAVDEKKAVSVCKARLELCETKLKHVFRYANLIQREAVMYKGAVQRFATTIQTTPRAVASLDRVLLAIDRYLTAQPDAGNTAGGVTVDQANPAYLEFLTPMKRAEADEPSKSEEPASNDKPASGEESAANDGAESNNETASSEPGAKP